MSLAHKTQNLMIAPADAFRLDDENREIADRIQLFKMARFENVADGMSGLCIVRHLSPNFASFDTSMDLVSGDNVILDMGGCAPLHGQIVGRIKKHCQMALTASCDPRRIIQDETGTKGARKNRKSRFSLAKPIAVQTKSSIFPAKLINISTRGASFSFDRPIDTLGNVKISAPDCDIVAGDITWKNSRKCGFKFHQELSVDALAGWLV